MDLNHICLGLLGLVPLYLIYLYWMTPAINPYPSIPGLLVAIDTGKSKQSVSKHGDASMATESLRRRTILSVGRQNPKKIRETITQLGSGTGYLETFLLSSICPGFCPCPYPNNLLYDGGNATNEYCPLDDNINDGEILDAGNATTEGCCPYPNNVLYDGGNATNEYCPLDDNINDGEILDAGNATTQGCA